MTGNATRVGGHVEAVASPTGISRDNLVTDFKAMHDGHVPGKVIGPSATVLTDVDGNVAIDAPVGVLALVGPGQGFINKPTPGPAA